MALIERIFRARIDWDGDSQKCEADWLEALRHAEDHGEVLPDRPDVWEEIGKVIDNIVGSFGDVTYTDNGDGPCWNAYIILESENEQDLIGCVQMIETVIRAHRYARLLEDT